jgi:hypothetical protein
LQVRGAVGANSDDWRESLALCGLGCQPSPRYFLNTVDTVDKVQY